MIDSFIKLLARKAGIYGRNAVEIYRRLDQCPILNCKPYWTEIKNIDSKSLK